MSKSQEELRYVMLDRLCLMGGTAVLTALGVLTFAIGVVALATVEDSLVAGTFYVIIALFLTELSVLAGLRSAVAERLRREQEVCALLGFQPPSSFTWIFRAGLVLGLLAIITMVIAALARGVTLVPF